MVHLIYFRLEILFLGKFGPKSIFASLSWNLLLRVIPIFDFRVSMAILNLVDIPVGGASWSFDLGKVGLNHTCSLKG